LRFFALPSSSDFSSAGRLTPKTAAGLGDLVCERVSMSCGGAANLIFIGVRLRLLEGPGLLGAGFKYSGGGTALFDGGGGLREVGSAAPGATVKIGTT
jgi:hypothetical protein